MISAFRTRVALATAGIGLLAAGLASAQAPEFAEAADAPLSAEQVEASRTLFNDFSCGACHALGDAGGTGQIGPALDGNANLDKAYVVSRVANGQGAMPGFGGMISAEQIDQLARYIVQVKK